VIFEPLDFIARLAALMIRGLTMVGRVLDREDLLDAATDALNVIRETLYKGGQLLASCKDGRARFDA
jgi:uncharacterized protein YyaL (SSP411 family)